MDAQTKAMNDAYRSEEPSPKHQYAFKMVIETGSIPDSTCENLVSELYDPFEDRHKNTPVDPWEPALPTQDTGNGLGRAVTRDGVGSNGTDGNGGSAERATADHGITIHVSEKLYHQQPIGVLLRPINDAVRKRGEALVTRTRVYAEGVQPEVMNAKHYSLRVEPLPCWLAKWIGENGYPVHKRMA